ncbi:two-component-system connector protein YmgA [Escherichia coli]|uniref:two-component-system connector protein YmgA n=1 Tax=Escherichia coli TaxID=562 RepID=UPI003AB7D88F
MKTITYLSDTGCLEIQGASLLRMKINFSLQTLIKQLLVMKSAEEDAFRRDLIDSIIRDFSNSDSGGPNRRTATADNKSMFNGKKINRIH